MTDEEFDPRSVPAFPTVHVRLRRDEDGTTRGEVDGAPVTVDQADATGSLMAEAAQRAANRPLKAVRVSATDAEDTTWLMIVHADGRTWDVDSLNDRTDSTGMSRRLIAGLAAGTLVFGIAGLGSAWAISANQSEEKRPEPKAAPPGEAPVVPVQGWARRAGWVSPPLAENTSAEPGVLTTKAGIVTTLDKNGGSLAALRPRDGATLWTSPLPDRLTAPPQLTSFKGREAIAAASSNTLTVWPATSAPKPTEWEFTEASMKMVEDSPVPLLASEDTNTALVLHGTQLKKRIVPAGATPVTADDKGGVIAADDDGRWWRLTAKDTAPRPSQLQPPTYGAEASEVLGIAGRTLLVAWKDEEGTLIAGYATENKMEPVWSKRVEDTPTANDVSVAPNGSWAVIGKSAITTESGARRALPEQWKTRGITNDAAWSRDHMIPRRGSAKTLKNEVEDDEGIPVAATKNHGFIVAKDTKATRIFALENDPGRHYDAGEPVKPSPTTDTAQKKKAEAKKKTQAKKDAAAKKKAADRKKAKAKKKAEASASSTSSR